MGWWSNLGDLVGPLWWWWWRSRWRGVRSVWMVGCSPHVGRAAARFVGGFQKPSWKKRCGRFTNSTRGDRSFFSFRCLDICFLPKWYKFTSIKFCNGVGWSNQQIVKVYKSVILKSSCLSLYLSGIIDHSHSLKLTCSAPETGGFSKLEDEFPFGFWPPARYYLSFREGNHCWIIIIFYDVLNDYCIYTIQLSEDCIYQQGLNP